MTRAAVLCGLLATLALVLAWELVAPDRGADVPPPLGGPAAVAPRPGAAAGSASEPMPGFDTDGLAEVAAAINARPLFSSTRRPADQPTRTAAAVTAGADGLPRLTGVVVGPTGARAIFAGADGKSRAMAEGDAVGGFTVRGIGPGLVTLSGSEGDRVLRPTYVTAPHVPAPAAAGIAPPDATPGAPLGGNAFTRPHGNGR